MYLSLTSAMSISARLSALWTPSSNLATNEGTASSPATFSLTSLATISFVAINSAELKGVLIVQGTTSYLLGIIRPFYIESWYDENQWNLAFVAQNTTNPNVYGTTLIPDSTTGNWSTNYTSSLASPNPYNSNIRQIKPIEYYHPGAYGSVCNTSSDLAWCASTNIVNTGVDELVTSNATYLYIGKSGAGSCSLVVRTA